MTREEAKELLPLITAFAEGKNIEYKNEFGSWKGTDNPLWTNHSKYRIKPEPKYRPFKNQEECLNEMRKHSDFGWVINKNNKNIYHINAICCDDLCLDETSLNYLEAFTNYEFLDGRPFGMNDDKPLSHWMPISEPPKE